MGPQSHRPAGIHHQTAAGTLHFRQQVFQRPLQGIPDGGYNVITEALLEGIDVRLGVDFFKSATSFPPSPTRWCTPAPSMPITTTSTARYSTAACVSNMKCWKAVEDCRGSAVVTATTHPCLTRASSSTSTFEFGTQRIHHYEGISIRVEAGHGDVLPGERRPKPRLQRRLKEACNKRGRRRLRWPAGRVSLLRHAPDYWVGTGDCKEKFEARVKVST